MEPKNSKIFSKEMLLAVSAFCESQDIKDVDKFMYLCFKQGFDIKRYGLLGETLNEGEKDLITDDNSEKIGGEQKKWVEKEVIVEKRVEIPVEVIKEVIVEKEIIKEVPVEVVKEVEKIVTITNNEDLEEKILQLNKDLESERKIFSTKTEEMENNFQNEMSKKELELDELRRSLDISKENNKTKLLQETLQNLRGELQQKNEQIKELEKINRDLLNGNQNQAYLLRGSNLNRRI